MTSCCLSPMMFLPTIPLVSLRLYPWAASIKHYLHFSSLHSKQKYSNLSLCLGHFSQQLKAFRLSLRCILFFWERCVLMKQSLQQIYLSSRQQCLAGWMRQCSQEQRSGLHVRKRVVVSAQMYSTSYCQRYCLLLFTAYWQLKTASSSSCSAKQTVSQLPVNHSSGLRELPLGRGMSWLTPTFKSSTRYRCSSFLLSFTSCLILPHSTTRFFARLYRISSARSGEAAVMSTAASVLRQGQNYESNTAGLRVTLSGWMLGWQRMSWRRKATYDHSLEAGVSSVILGV